MEKGEVWKVYMERMVNEESDWDGNVEGDPVEGQLYCISRDKVVQTLNKMKTGQASGPLDLSLDLIATSREVGIQVMLELCQGVLDRLGMPAEYVLYIVVHSSSVRVTSGTAVTTDL